MDDWFPLAFAGLLTLWGSLMLWLTHKTVHDRHLARVIHLRRWHARVYHRDPAGFLSRWERARRLLRAMAWVCLVWGGVMLGARALSL